MVECEKGLLNYGDKLVIMGDLNSNLSQVSSPQTKFLFSFMKQFHLHELVQSPTRVTATTTSQLDLILTNIPSFFRIRLPFHLAGVIILLCLHTSVLEVSASHWIARSFILDVTVNWIKICSTRSCLTIPGMRFLVLII